jgi:hypothetical protein
MLFDKSDLRIQLTDKIYVGKTILGVSRGYLLTLWNQYVCKPL